jgi:hypothetical protein
MNQEPYLCALTGYSGLGYRLGFLRSKEAGCAKEPSPAYPWRGFSVEK